MLASADRALQLNPVPGIFASFPVELSPLLSGAFRVFTREFDRYAVDQWRHRGSQICRSTALGKTNTDVIRELDMLEVITPRDKNRALADAIGEIAFPKLYVHKDVFSELQAIQRSQASPKFDLKDIGSSALRIVLALPNAAELIKERVMEDFLTRRQL